MIWFDLIITWATSIDADKCLAFTETQVHPDTLLHWLKKQVTLYDTVCVKDMSSSFKDGLALCAIIHRYRPDLVDFPSLQPQNVAANNQLAFDILEREFNIPPVSKTRHLKSGEEKNRKYYKVQTLL